MRTQARRFERLVILLLGSALVAVSLSQARSLTFEERVEAQRAIEKVAWQHRIWPAENPSLKPSLEAVLSDETLRRIVADNLRKSAALERALDITARSVGQAGRPAITPRELQAEMNRMARQTQRPEILAELFAGLGDDPYLIAECLVRPILTDRILAGSAEKTFALDTGRFASAPDGGPAELQVNDFQGADASSGQGTVRSGLLQGSGLNDDIVPRGGISQDIPVQTDLASFVDLNGQSRPSGSSAPGDAIEYVLPTITSPLTCQDDTWTPTSTTAVSPGRAGHAAVWTGSEMIVWGGINTFGLPLSGGHRYNPATDSWSMLPPPPGGQAGGSGTTAVWTGTRVIVWGGGYVGDFNAEDWNTGARFDPVASTWAATSTGSGVPSARHDHTAVWTGTRMIVWGGFDYTDAGGGGTSLNTGGQYDPETDTWSPTNAGLLCNGGARSGETCLSGGDCPGACNGGAVPGESCSPADPMACAGACSLNHAVLCRSNTQCSSQGAGACSAPPPGTCMDAGNCQNLDFAPSARSGHTAVWTGSRMVIWGGSGAGAGQTGGRYDPVADSWTPTSTGANVPSARSRHAAVWTGSRMIVWGGPDQTGGRYDPVGDSWTPTSTGTNVPAARAGLTGIWTGSEMIVWGGTSTNTGGRYSPATDSWNPTSTGSGNPSARSFHSAVWTGSEMIVWGGGGFLNTGGRYCASSTCAVVPWYRDVDGDGYGRSSDTVLSCTQPPGYAAYGGDCNEANPAVHPDAVEACDGIDADCDGNPDPLAPAGSSELTEAKVGLSTAQVSWTPIVGATSYDLVRGSLTTLAASHGNFTAATDLCIGNDLAATTKPDPGTPAAGTGMWYLVRGVNCGGAGTYDSGATSQVGSRDAEIQASAGACP